MTKAANQKERHAIEEQQQMFRKKRETLEIQIEIDATTAKNNDFGKPEIQWRILLNLTQQPSQAGGESEGAGA